MAERIAEKMAADAGVTGVRFTSAAVTSQELGHPIDPRGVRELARGSYRTADHRAHRITADEVRGADLVIGMEQYHLDRLARLVPGATNLALMTDFDPAATPGTEVDDPWYGPDSAFAVTRAELETAMPGVLAWVREHARAA